MRCRRSAGCRSRWGRARSPATSSATARRRCASTTGSRARSSACSATGSEEWARRLLRRCIAAALLAVDAERGTLHITRRGAEVAAGSRPNPVRAAAGAPLRRTRRPHCRRAIGRRPRPARAPEGVAAAPRRRRRRAGVRHLSRRDARGDRGSASGIVRSDAARSTASGRRSCSATAPRSSPRCGATRTHRRCRSICARTRSPRRIATRRRAGDGAKVRNFSEYQLSVRRSYPRAYDRWTDEDDAPHPRAVRSRGRGRRDLPRAAAPAAGIEARLEKLGLAPPRIARPA